MGMTAGVLLFPLIQQAAPFFTIGILQSIQERFTFPMIEQRIEVVRRAAAASPCPIPVADQAIIGQVLEWNLRMAHEQEANRQWYADIFSTDRWNDVQEIPLPCEVMETRK